MDSERIERFFSWLAAQERVTARAIHLHPDAPQTDGWTMSPSEICMLLAEAGYVQITAQTPESEDPADIVWMPAEHVGVNEDGSTYALERIEAATAAQLRDYVRAYGSALPPDAPGLWLWFLEGGYEDAHVRFRPADYAPGYEGDNSPVCFLWPDKTRSGWQNPQRLERDEDGSYRAFRCGRGRWICAPLPAFPFRALLEPETKG